MWDPPDQEAALDAYAGVCTLINGRAARVFEVVRRAADEAPGVAELRDTLQRNRRTGARMVIEHVASPRPLPDALDIERATDILWVFNNPTHYDGSCYSEAWPGNSL